MSRLILVSFLIVALPVHSQDSASGEPKEFVQLHSSWERARIEATRPIDKKYVDALTQMKLRFTKAGDLKSALFVEGQLEKLTASMGTSQAESKKTRKLTDFTTNDEFKAWLETTVWHKGPTAYTFANGTMTEQQADKKLERAFTITDKGSLSWTWSPSEGNHCIMEVAKDLKTASLKSTKGAPYEITRDAK